MVFDSFNLCVKTKNFIAMSQHINNSCVMRSKTKSYYDIVIILFLLFFLQKNVYSDCIKNFLIFDIGSSTTKSILYKKDICNGKKIIDKQVFNHNYPYQACLSDTQDNILPDACIEGGVQAIQIIKDHFNLKCDGDAQCVAIATGWARYMQNPTAWSDAVRKTNVEPIIASQNYEGEMKLNAIKANTISQNKSFLGFDIGGGSFQLGWFDEKNHLHQYNSNYGTDNFTHDLQEKFFSLNEKKCIRARNNFILVNNGSADKKSLKQASDNISQECAAGYRTTLKTKELDQAIAFTYEQIGKPISENMTLRNFIKNNKPVIYADSLLFSLGIRKQLGYDRDIITIDDVHKIMVSIAGMTYDQVKKTYPNLPDICINTTQPSMLILYSLMRSLNIDEIHIIQTDYMEHFVDSQIKN